MFQKTVEKELIKGTKLVEKKSISIFNQRDKWDVLILLDGCRYGTFKKINTLKGKLKKRVSVASCTLEWVIKSINQKYEDIIYISANPFLSNVYFSKIGKKDPFFHLEEVWDYGWNEDLRTVPPFETTNAALRLREKYPAKKFFIHYIQPHHPFIGERRIREGGWEYTRNQLKDIQKQVVEEDVYSMLKEGVIKKEEVIQAYEDNLRLVLKEAEKIIKNFKSKKIIVTSDHGDCFGEYGIYAHPENTYIKELILVPWFEIK